MTTVLALRSAGLGDLLTSVPALRALSAPLPGQKSRRDGPGTQLQLATAAWLRPLLPLLPGKPDHVPVAGLIPVTRNRPDLTVNLHGCGPQSHRALLAAHPKRLLAYRCPGIWEDGPAWDPDEPERVRWCRLLAHGGIQADPRRLSIAAPDVPPVVAGAVVLHLGAGHKSRVWPAEHFLVMARDLRDHYPVVLTGLPTEAASGSLIRRTAKLPHEADQVGRLNLLELAAVVAHARLVISGDTGVAHLAAAYGVPSVTIFGPASPKRWGPPTNQRHRVLRAPGPHPTAAAVPPWPVREHVRDLLGLTGAYPTTADAAPTAAREMVGAGAGERT